MEEQIKQIGSFIDQLESNDFNIYFFTLDTKGNPTAGIANIYEHVKQLTELGYKAHILHEKNDYKLVGDEDGMGIADWLGVEYSQLSHVSIEGQGLNIQPVDFIVIPEIFSNIMEQIKAFPCRKIVLCQSYDYMLELLPIGKRWNTDYGFFDVITTSERQAEYVRTLFQGIATHVIPVSIPEYFTKSEKPKIPVVTLSCRNQAETAKIAKAFYLKYPMYKWITFKDLRGLPRDQFASELSKSCLSVWVDESAGFGTFPIEAMECETPVIGKIPNMIPEWMETTDENGNPVINNNGIWTNTTLNIPELIATYLKVWLEDTVPADLLEAMKNTTGKYTLDKQMASIKEVYGGLIENRKKEFNNILNKLTVSETEKQ